jgi:hypothetical protein
LKLKILFICGSLERGKDGVGDYTRRLAGELMRREYDCQIIALNDRFIHESVKEFQDNFGISIMTYRLPQYLSWKSRMETVKEYASSFAPDFTSLQYVPYAYHKKGMPINLSKFLMKSVDNTKWHIMFHELWVGKDSLKLTLTAMLQKGIIRKMIKDLDPAVIHTHLPAYFNKLKLIGNNINDLSLFSNFAPLPNKNLKRNPTIFKLAFFNLVSDHPSIIKFIKELDTELTHHNRKLEILLIGGAVSKLNEFKIKLINQYNFKYKIDTTGFVEDAQLSLIIDSCDMGITSLPRSAVGKSGTSIAFLAAGVPLAVPINDNKDEPFFNQQLSNCILHIANIKQFELAKSTIEKEKHLLKISYIADKFLSDIKKFK